VALSAPDFLLKNLDGSWSNPVACGVAGVGFGILIGAALKCVVIIFMAGDESV
jgi:lipid-binding SYLF domain-containing protein